MPPNRLVPEMPEMEQHEHGDWSGASDRIVATKCKKPLISSPAGNAVGQMLTLTFSSLAVIEVSVSIAMSCAILQRAFNSDRESSASDHELRVRSAWRKVPSA